MFEPDLAEPDGRRRRSLDSRARIVAALLELTREGLISPSAELVAGRAGVGLRTVFRHFNDMESLYREMSDTIEVELRAAAARPFAGATWRARLLEMVERRAEGFEAIAPFRRASDVYRRGSKVLQDDHAMLAAALRAILVRETPEHLRRDKARFEALDLLLSYEAWSRLRDEQRLSPTQARAALSAAVVALIGPEA
ncbi:MAG TPA: TetR/AcrR family transcriptional regulator [Caulobacteraceae bacterium]|jgi:AcrR family transcriptional regulator